MPNSEDTNAMHLVSDILNKLIEVQERTAETNAALRQSVEESNEILASIHSHFTNGFRSEIKKHMTNEISQYKSEIATDEEALYEGVKSTNSKLDKLLETIQKPWFWIKFIGMTVAGLGAVIATIATVLAKLGG